MKNPFQRARKCVVITATIYFVFFSMTTWSHDENKSTTSAKSAKSVSINPEQEEQKKRLNALRRAQIAAKHRREFAEAELTRLRNPKFLSSLSSRESQIAAKEWTQYYEARLAELNDPRYVPLLAEYQLAIKEAIRRNWKTEHVPQPYECQFEYFQSRGGKVYLVTFLGCPTDSRARDSIETALKGNPLPYYGYELVFKGVSTITICYPENLCD